MPASGGLGMIRVSGRVLEQAYTRSGSICPRPGRSGPPGAAQQPQQHRPRPAAMARKGIFFPLKDAALRDDVHALGELVGEVLKDQCGQALFDAVEGDRHAAIGRRQGEPEAAVEMVVRTQDRPPAAGARPDPRVLDVVPGGEPGGEGAPRAPAPPVHERQQHAAARRARGCFARLRGAGACRSSSVIGLLGRLSIEPVLTAHPTESTRRTLLRQQQRIARLLIGRLDPTRTPGERRATIERVRTELTTGWQTAGNSRDRLTVADEREHVLFFLVEVIYEVIPAFYEEVEAALRAVFGAAADGVRVPELLHFGTWVGGDMDGHPDVHAKTIRESCLRHHQLIVNRYFLEAQALAERLSQSASRVAVSPQVMRAHRAVPEPAAGGPGRDAGEPRPHAVSRAARPGGGAAARHLRRPFLPLRARRAAGRRPARSSPTASRRTAAGTPGCSTCGACCAACAPSVSTSPRSTCARTPTCTAR